MSRGEKQSNKVESFKQSRLEKEIEDHIREFRHEKSVTINRVIEKFDSLEFPDYPNDTAQSLIVDFLKKNHGSLVQALCDLEQDIMLDYLKEIIREIENLK